MSDSEEDVVEKQLKIVFVGEPNVGKTSLIKKLCYDEFSRQYTATVGADFYLKRIILPGKRDVTLKLCDLGGLEMKGSMLDKYLFSTDIIVLVYDITNASSFECMNLWIDTISNLITSPPFTAIFGNKCDLEHQRTVRLDKTNQFMREQGLLSFLMSAKTGEAVSASLLEMVAKHLMIPLTRLEKESQQSVLKVELVPTPLELPKRKIQEQHTKTSVCNIQ